MCEGRRWMSPLKQQNKLALSLPSLSIQADWIMSTHTGEGDLLYLVCQFKASFFWKPLHRHNRRNVLSAIRASLSPVTLTHKINHPVMQLIYLYIFCASQYDMGKLNFSSQNPILNAFKEH